MKAATLTTLRKEMEHLPQKELIAICLRLARFKKMNKELLHYLLFEQNMEHAYIASIKEEVQEDFDTLELRSVYSVKKGVQKILRKIKQYIRYSGKKETEVELLIYFCQLIRETGVPIHRSSVLTNMYERQINAIHKALEKVHEDLRFDFADDLEELAL